MRGDGRCNTNGMLKRDAADQSVFTSGHVGKKKGIFGSDDTLRMRSGNPLSQSSI